MNGFRLSKAISLVICCSIVIFSTLTSTGPGMQPARAQKQTHSLRAIPGAPDAELAYELALAPSDYIAWAPGCSNNDDIIDPDECNLFRVILFNYGDPLTNVIAHLSTHEPQVTIERADAAYGDIAYSSIAGSATAFRVSTSPGFIPMGQVDFSLIVTATEGVFTIPFSIQTLATESHSDATRNDSDAQMHISTPPVTIGTITSTLTVSSIEEPIARVAVSLYINHGSAGDLTTLLIAPDGTVVTLTLTGNTGKWGWGSLGAGCNPDSLRTTFVDSATLSISNNSLYSFKGSFRPMSPLNALNQKYGAAINGDWHLRVSDTEPNQQYGDLMCWSLFITTWDLQTTGLGTCDNFPDLMVSTSVRPTVTTSGQLITVTLGFTNAGGGAAGNAVITDQLPQGMVVSQTASSGTPINFTPYGDGIPTWETSELPPGASGLITLTGYISASSPPGILTNSADIASAWDLDPSNNSASSSFTVINLAPTASIRPLGAVYVRTKVTLDGSLSTDPDGRLPLTYGWRQTGGSPVALSKANTVSATFTAPTRPGVLTFTLTVTDAVGLAGTPKSVAVTVKPYNTVYLPALRKG
jgi:uncharacterized repeat protein (TIGR01451 family)